MTRIGKAAWVFAFLSLAILIVARGLIGGWLDGLLIPLALFLISFFVAVISNFKFYVEVMKMRATKKGLSMGWLVLMVISFLGALNYFGLRFDKSLDVTDERVNSLSSQSIKVLGSLDSDFEVYIFYRGGKDLDALKNVTASLDLYRKNSKFVNIQPIDVYVHREFTKEVLKNNKVVSGPVVRVKYKGRTLKVDEPFGEVQISKALISATRHSSKNVYFLTGHGERSLGEESDEGLSELVLSLKESAYNVKSLNLIAGQKLPSDTSVLAIVGPVSSLLDSELNVIRDFARSGGRIFIAADPGQRHHLALLTKTFGVEFKNNFILNDSGKLIGRGAASSLGIQFNPRHEITQGFRTGENIALFDLASEIARAPGGRQDLDVLPLVFSPSNSYVVNDLSMAEDSSGAEKKSMTIGAVVSGELGSIEELKGKSGKTRIKESNRKEQGETKFSAVIFGDSDFLSNQAIFQGINRDLALNAFSYLAKESDLVSIRPKKIKATPLVLTTPAQFTIIGSGIVIPILFFGWGGLVWLRRRGA